MATPREESSMVQVKDEGVFDAPIDRIWKYLNDQTPGVHNHRAIAAKRILEQDANQAVQEMDVRNPDGRTIRKETWRTTFNPPTGFEMEALSGASKGTRYTHRYTPMGSRTKVEVIGDFKIQGMDENATKQAALSQFAQFFEEDNANLRNYR
jgi:hypothetical protein